MKEPTWLNAADVYGIHKELIAISGGKTGILNAGLITSSLSKAKNVFHYSKDTDLFVLTAVYSYGFIKNHCFLDGNKRVGLIVVYTFLAINGVELIASEEDVVKVFSELAASQASQATDVEKLSQWLRENTKTNKLLRR
jgi:death-on-curing protein